MDPDIKNGMFVIRNQHVECVPEKEIKLSEKLSGKTNLFKIIHKLESEVSNDRIPEKELKTLKGRISGLQEKYNSKIKSSKLFEAVMKIYDFFGMNILKGCNSLEKVIENKEKEASEEHLSKTGRILGYELTDAQKKFKNAMVGNIRTINDKILKIWDENSSKNTVSNELVEYLARNSTKEKVQELLEESFNIEIINEKNLNQTFSGTITWNALPELISNATTSDKNYLKDLIIEMHAKDLSVDIDAKTLSTTVSYLKYFSDQDACDFILKVFKEGSLNNILNLGNKYEIDGLLKNLNPSDFEHLPTEQLLKVIRSDVLNLNNNLCKCFTVKVAEKLFKDKETADKAFIFIGQGYPYSFEPDFHIFALKKAFEFELGSRYKFTWNDTPEQFLEKIKEVAKEKSETPFLLWSSYYIKELEGNTKELYEDLISHVSKLNNNMNAAELFLDIFANTLKNPKKQDFNKNFEEGEFINLYLSLLKNGLNRDLINNIILPMSKGRAIYIDVYQLKRALIDFFLYNKELFLELRDPDAVNSLLDFLINDNNSEEIYRGFFRKENTAPRFINKYLVGLELPKDAKLYAFVLQRLANKYSTTFGLLPHDFNSILNISLPILNLLNINEAGEELFSFEVYNEIIDDYKPLYIHLYKPWLEGEFLDHLNSLELTDKTALTFEVIMKGLRDQIASQIAEGPDFFKSTQKWSPEMLLLLFSVSQDNSYSKTEEENRLSTIQEIKNIFSKLNLNTEEYVKKLLEHIESKETKSSEAAKELLRSLIKLDDSVIDSLPGELNKRLTKILLQ